MARSLRDALLEFGDLAFAISDMFEGDNEEGIDLNDFTEYYPFNKSFDQVVRDLANWIEDIDNAIGGHTFKRESKEAGKKLSESWEGEDEISDLVERAKMLIDDGDDVDEAVQRAIDDGLIYTKSIRTLAEHYDVLPSDSELIGLFYEQLYEDIYNEVSDYWEEVHEEDDEEVEESLKRVKSLIEKRGSKFEFDEDDLVVEVEKVKNILKKNGVETLTDIPFRTIKSKYPNFAKWFERYHKGMEGNDAGELDDNSAPIEEYWESLDDVDFAALLDYIKHRAKQIPLKYYMQHAKLYDSGLDETEVLADKIASGEIKMANGGH